jgi:hypothetical protein
MKLLLLGILLKTIQSINVHPSHFRIVPLSFYTPNNRNEQYFKDDNYYGVRIAWIASKPPSDSIVINDSKQCITLSWKVRGGFNPHKNDWGNGLWDYAFVDTALHIEHNLIKIGEWSYNIKVPRFGKKENDDDTTLFIGDANIGSSSRFALGGADAVIKSSLLKQQNKTTMVVWLGDVFYHDKPNSITSEWPRLTDVSNNIINGVPTFLHIGLIGNHDYSSNTACHNCNWNIRRNGLSCINDNKVSGSWVQYFFTSDGIKSFHDGLSENYHRGCRVPYEYTIQNFVLGRTGYITVDNAWHPNDVNINWSDLSNKLNNYVDNIIVIGHWDYSNSGGKSGVSDWIHKIEQYFRNKKITGVQGHTHINSIRNGNGNFKLITAGGNGFRGSGCDCKGNCYNCHCCCPTLYKNNNWIIGGWNKGEFCNQ